MEGHYKGILKSDEHYLSVKEELLNIAEVIDRFKDETARTLMFKNTHEYFLSAHT